MKGQNSFWQQHLSRRRTLRAAAVGTSGLLVATLAGCSAAPAKPSTGRTVPSTGGSATAAAQQPKRGGTLVHRDTLVTAGRPLDPHRNLLSVGIGLRLWYQGLLGYDARTLALKPELAQKWEQPSQTEYLFHVQSGVKWHNKPPVNGRTLTASDIAFSLERARTNDPQFANRSTLVSVDKIEAPDSGTVRITSKVPDATVLNKLSSDGLTVLAPEVVEKAKNFLTADEVVGTGPFVLQTVQQNVSADSVRNADYWKPGLPYLDRFVAKYLEDDQSAYAALKTGQIDVMQYLPGQIAKDFISSRGPGYTPDWFNDTSVIMLHPNAQQKPCDDPRVTRALRLLIDHQEFITAWSEVWFGRGRHASIFPTVLQDWDLADAEYEKYADWQKPKDKAVTDALALLSAAGFTKDRPLKDFTLTTYGVSGTFVPAAAELLQGQWKRLGQGVVNANIKLVDSATWGKLRATGDFEYMTSGVITFTEPDSWLTEVYRTGASQNNARSSDPTLDAMIDRQRTTFDATQRKAQVRDIIVYMIDHAPGAVGANRFLLSGAAPRVRDYTPEGIFLYGAQYEHVWLAA